MNIFEPLFKYGFHDTEISSIDGDGLEIRLNFGHGIYILDEHGKETSLSEPIQIILIISSYFDSFEKAIEIKEYGKKLKYIDFIMLKKYLQKETFEILMHYYSNFNNCLLFDGGFTKKNILLSIECIEKIIIRKLKK